MIDKKTKNYSIHVWTNQVVEQMAGMVSSAEAVAVKMQEVANVQVKEAAQITESENELNGYTRTVQDDSCTVAQNAKELENTSRNLMEEVNRFRI